ncbi:MAG: right-handed parallel beta-helix repeat-containing protein [archaeon]
MKKISPFKIYTFALKRIVSMLFFVEIGFGAINEQIISVSPLQNALDVYKNADITVAFSVDINPATINPNTYIIYASQTGLHTGTYTYNSGTKTILFDPDFDFASGEIVTVTLTKGIHTALGSSISNPFIWNYTIQTVGGTGIFAFTEDFGVGSSPRADIAGDLDGDKDLDIVTANWGSTMSILVNRSNGTFLPKMDYSTGNSSHGIINADFDLDGDIDLAIVNHGGATVSIFKNYGDGTFTNRADYSTGSYPGYMSGADFNADGYVDLVVGNVYGSTISIFLNNGDGTFASMVDYSAGSSPHYSFCADFDSDGDIDIAIAIRGSNTVSIIKNNGDGTFATGTDYSTRSDPCFPLGADFDSDGDVDIAVPTGTDNVSILINNGDGTFEPRIDYHSRGGGGSQYSCSDFDSDGDIDFTVVVPDSIYIIHNDGYGHFGSLEGSYTGIPSGYAVSADLDGDNDMDLAVTLFDSNKVSILLGRNRESEIHLSSTLLNFGIVNIGLPDTLQFIIYNNSIENTLNISNITSSNPDFEPSTFSSTILPGDRVIISVSFTPTGYGNYHDSLTITSNDPDNPTVYVKLTGLCGNYVSGVITDNTTWTKANSPYIMNGDFGIDTDITLTIEAGVEIRFDGLYNFNIYGNLIVEGTSSDTVLIASVADLSPGLWSKLNFAQNSTGELHYLKLQGSQEGIYAGSASALSIDNSLIEQNSSYGIYLSSTNATITNTIVRSSGTGISASSCSPKITNCTLTNNSTGFSGSASSPEIDFCTISNNTGSGIYFTSSTSSPIITNSVISDNNGYGIQYSYGYGVLKVDGNQITGNDNWGLFIGGASSGTEVKNNDITNNVGGIYSNFDDGTIHTTIENNTISGNSGDGVYATNSSGTIRNNTIENNTGDGIETTHWELGSTGNITIDQNNISGNNEDGIKTSTNPTITYNEIIGNSSDGIETSGLPIVNYNNFSGNASYHIRVTAQPTGTINAENNYWGTTIENDIKAKIWDFYDTGGGVAKVDYTPFYTKQIDLLPVEGFRAQTLSGGQVKLSWSAHPFARQYHLYHDNQTSVIDTSFAWVTLDSTRLEYVCTLSDGEYIFGIKAEAGDGRISTLVTCQSLVDGTPPIMLSATGISGDTTITVTFSENVDPISVEPITNWTLSQGLETDSVVAIIGNYWTTKTSMPTARASLSCASVNDKIYAIGGGNNGNLSTVEEYDPVFDQWTTKASMPTARRHLSSAVVDGKIYVIGGLADSHLSTVEEYDPLTNAWHTKKPMLTPRRELACAVVNRKIYAIGGYIGYPIGIVEMYDPAIDEWITKSSMPTPRASLACAVVNGKIYAIGGGDVSQNSTVEEYDPVTNQWTTRAPMPTPRKFFDCASINGKIYAIGGYNDEEMNIAKVEEYNPVTDTWSTKTNMPTGRNGLAIAAVYGRLYAIGGSRSDGALSTVEEYVIFDKNVQLYLTNNLPSPETLVDVTSENIQDIYGNQSGEQSCSFHPDDNNANPVANLTDITSEQSGNITIGYSVTDVENDIVQLTSEYSIDNGLTWFQATVSGKTLGLQSSEYTNGTLIWHSGTDITDCDFSQVKFRITPRDADPYNSGTPDETNPFRVDNYHNQSISIALTDSAREYNNSVRISYSIIDSTGDIINIKCYYKIDQVLYPASITGVINNITSEKYRGELIWDSEEDLGERDIEKLRLILVPGDEWADGYSDSTAFFHLDNNSPPIVTIRDLTGEKSGDIRINYTLVDAEYDTLGITVFYTIDQGINWTRATVIGDTSGIDKEKYQGEVIWDSDLDLPNRDISLVKMRILPHDNDLGIGDTTTDFHLDNNVSPLVNLTDKPGINTGDIGINYQLSDSESDTLDVRAEYFDETSGLFKDAHVIGLTSGIDSSHYKGVLTWQSLTDVPNVCDTMRFKITPEDNDVGKADTIAIFVDNRVPSIALSDISGEQSGDIPIHYTLSNDSLSVVSLHCEYSPNSGANWLRATVTGDTVGIVYSRYAGSLVWKSGIDLAGKDLLKVRFRITPKDIHEGISDETADFHLDNNLLPTIVIQELQGEKKNDVSIQYQLNDTEHDSLKIRCQYYDSLSRIWIDASISGDRIGIVEYSNNLIWYTLLDLPSAAQNVLFRIIPSDKDEGVSDTINITLDNLGVPSIQITANLTSEQTGEVVLSYLLNDDEHDTLSIITEYSPNSGASWLRATVVGDTAGIDYSGYVDSLVWKSGSDLAGKDLLKVRFRITPKDVHVGISDETVDFHLDNNVPPLVNLTDKPGINTGDIFINYQLSDSESDTLDVRAEYFDDTNGLFKAAHVIGLTSGIDSSRYKGVLTWQSIADVPNVCDTIRLKITPEDNDVGKADTIVIFVDNRVPSIVLSDLSGEQSGDIPIHYTLSNDSLSLVSLHCEYSPNGGASWLRATVIGDTAAIDYSGYVDSLVWKSGSDLAGKDLLKVRFRITPKDVHVGISDETVDFHLDNNVPPLVNLTDKPGINTGDIFINYQLSDSESDTLDVRAEYFDDTNGLFKAAHVIGLTSGIDSSRYKGVLTWQSIADVPNVCDTIRLKITPEDNDVGKGDTIQIFVDNRVPSILLSDLSGEQSGDIPIHYTLSNDSLSEVSLHCEYSIDEGVHYNKATVQGDTSGIEYSSYHGSITWRSMTDLQGIDLMGIRFRITPYDINTGISGQTNVFHLDNNDIPRITVAATPGINTGNISVSYILSDTERDTLDIAVEYFDKEMDIFKPATITGKVAELQSSGYSGVVIWQSALDVSEICDTIPLRIIPRDNDAGTADTISIFVDNVVPSISLLDINGEQAGNVVVHYIVKNDSLSSVSLHSEYSIDNGITWSLATVQGDSTDIRFDNYSGNVIWQSIVDLDGKDLFNTVFRITPSDINVGKMDSTNQFHLDNNSVPVIGTVFTPMTEQTGNVEIKFIVKDSENDTLNYYVTYSTDSGENWKQPSLNFIYNNKPPEKDTLSLIWSSNNDIPNLDLKTIKLKVIPMDNDTGIFEQTGVFHVDNETGPIITSNYPKDVGLWQDTVIIDFDRSIDTLLLAGNLLITGTKSGVISGKNLFFNNSKSVFFVPEHPFMAKETLSVKLNAGILDSLGKGLDGDRDGDPEGSPTDDYSWFFVTPYIGDYDNSGQVDIQDLILFSEAWQKSPQDLSKEIGPAQGTIPFLSLLPDSAIDFEDFVILARMWNWSLSSLGKITEMFEGNLQNNASTTNKLGKLNKKQTVIDDTEPRETHLLSDKYKNINKAKVNIVSLNPQINSDPWCNQSGGYFNINIDANTISNLKGAELIINYDQELLSFEGLQSSNNPHLSKNSSNFLKKESSLEEFLKSTLDMSENNLVLKNSTEGILILNIVTLSETESIVNENSNIVTLRFRVLKTGISDIKYYYSVYSEHAVLFDKNYSEVQIDSKLLIPDKFKLYQNFPNPFNSTTTIKYQIPVSTNVKINIYNLRGELVSTLINDRKEPGYYSTDWMCKNRSGENVSSGMYIYQIIANDNKKQFIQNKKMILLK